LRAQMQRLEESLLSLFAELPRSRQLDALVIMQALHDRHVRNVLGSDSEADHEWDMESIERIDPVPKERKKQA
jgi:hypothetical protein